MKYCTKCGQACTDDTIFCPNCGNRFSQGSSSSSTSSNNGQAKTALTLGIVGLSLSFANSFVLGFISLFALACSVPAIVFGFRNFHSGKGKAGAITGIIGTAYSSVFLILWIIYLVSSLTAQGGI